MLEVVKGVLNTARFVTLFLIPPKQYCFAINNSVKHSLPIFSNVLKSHHFVKHRLNRRDL